MSRRIRQCFSNASKQGRKVLIPFITAGDPEPDWTTAMMHSLVASGADLLELGIPFSDPMADGPVILKANQAALAAGIRVEDCFVFAAEMIQEFQQPFLVLAREAQTNSRSALRTPTSRQSI